MKLNFKNKLTFIDLSHIEEEQKTKITKNKNLCLKQVIPYVYLSDAESAQEESLLKQNNIKTIICLSVRSGCRKFKESYEYLTYDMKDILQDNIIPLLNKLTHVIDKFEKQKKNILIHCRKGISRAPIVILAYLMRYKQMDFEEAFNRLRDCDDKIDPNVVFLLQVKRFNDFKQDK